MDAIAETPSNSRAVMFPGNLPSGWPLLWCLKSYWRFVTNDPGRQHTLFALLKVGLGGITLTNATSPDADGVVHVLGIGSPEYPNFAGTTDTNFGLVSKRAAWLILIGCGPSLRRGTARHAIAGLRPSLNHVCSLMRSLSTVVHKCCRQAIVRWAARTLVSVGATLGKATRDPAVALYRSILKRMVSDTY